MHLEYCTVLITGRPNTGKSTLFNVLVGEKINSTSNKAHTTKSFRYAYANSKKQQIQYVDTPGYDNTKVSHLIQHANVVFILTTPHTWHDIDDKFAKICMTYKIPIVLIVNKTDKMRDWVNLEAFYQPLILEYGFRDILYISAKHKHHLQLVKKVIQRFMMSTQVLLPKIEIPLQDRIKEIILEKIFRTLHKELPHKVDVSIHVGVDMIYGFITVYKTSHKKIIIGKSGRTIGLIRTLCTEDLKNILQINKLLKLIIKS